MESTLGAAGAFTGTWDAAGDTRASSSVSRFISVVALSNVLAAEQRRELEQSQIEFYRKMAAAPAPAAC